MTRYLRVDCEPNELVEHNGTGIFGSLLTPARLTRRSLTGDRLAPSERVTELPDGWQVITEADNHMVRALWSMVDKTSRLATTEAELRDTQRKLDAAQARVKITRDVLEDQVTGGRVDNDRLVDELVKTARKRGHAEGALEANTSMWDDLYQQTKQKADAAELIKARAHTHAEYIKQLATLFGIDTDQHADDVTRDLRSHVEIAARVLSTVMARSVDDTAINAAPMYAAEAVNAVGVADALAVELDQRDERIAAMCRAAATEPENWHEVVPTIERMKNELTDARTRVQQLEQANAALQSAVGGGRAPFTAIMSQAGVEPQRTPGDPLEGIEDDEGLIPDDDVPPLLVPVGRYKLTTPAMGGPADRLDAAVLADGTFRIRSRGVDPDSDPETWNDYTSSARKLLAHGSWHIEAVSE